jgi:hypothetical protein
MGKADRGAADGIRGATERDRVWVRHLERIEAEGIAAKIYAAREGLSVHALYQAKKRLRQQGAWPEANGSAVEPTFTRVRLVETAPAAATPWALRLRLPSGAVLEWSVTPGADLLGTLLERVSSAR